MFYAVVYMFMNLGAFLVVLILEQKYKVETIAQCRGLGWTDPKLCTMMTIFLLSLTGLPPLAGFMGKLQVFGTVVRQAVETPNWDWLPVAMVVAGVLFSVVSLFYYVRILASMFLQSTDKPAVAEERTPLLDGLTWIMAAATLFFGIFWNQLYKICSYAAGNILGK
jgi:NADH-quinone oxidoreductase subunit N